MLRTRYQFGGMEQYAAARSSMMDIPSLTTSTVIDDGDRLRQTLEQIGLALLSTLNRIELDDLWDAIPNVSLILSMYFAWARTFKNAMHDQTWLVEALVYAEKHSMDVQGVHGIEEVLQEHSTETVDDGCIRRIRRPPLKDKHNFARQVCLFDISAFLLGTTSANLQS